MKALAGHEVYPLTRDQLAAWRKSAEPVVTDWEESGAQGRSRPEGNPRRLAQDSGRIQGGVLSEAMKRSEHRILTTHVGSLIRPKALLESQG
jgi:hypothetical protein